jgi:hypothetical protein
VPGQRSADEIERDIVQARASLAAAVDQLAHRTDPKRLLESTKAALLARARTPQGRAVVGAAGALLAVVVIRRIVKR